MQLRESVAEVYYSSRWNIDSSFCHYYLSLFIFVTKSALWSSLVMILDDVICAVKYNQWYKIYMTGPNHRLSWLINNFQKLLIESSSAKKFIDCLNEINSRQGIQQWRLFRSVWFLTTELRHPSIDFDQKLANNFQTFGGPTQRLAECWTLWLKKKLWVTFFLFIAIICNMWRNLTLSPMWPMTNVTHPHFLAHLTHDTVYSDITWPPWFFSVL